MCVACGRAEGEESDIRQSVSVKEILEIYVCMKMYFYEHLQPRVMQGILFTQQNEVRILGGRLCDLAIQVEYCEHENRGLLPGDPNLHTPSLASLFGSSPSPESSISMSPEFYC